jgi:hypothetical protein
MEKTQNKKELKETFRSFLVNLDVFLDTRSVVQNAKIEILFIQEPEEVINEYYSRGLIQVGQFAYPFEVTFDRELEVIKIDSQIFHFHLTLKEMIDFLKEHKGEA